jgi:hypothetical protein
VLQVAELAQESGTLLQTFKSISNIRLWEDTYLRYDYEWILLGRYQCLWSLWTARTLGS